MLRAVSEEKKSVLLKQFVHKTKQRVVVYCHG